MCIRVHLQECFFVHLPCICFCIYQLHIIFINLSYSGVYILIVCVFLQYTSQLYLSFYISTSRRRKPYCAEPATHLGRDPRAPVRHLFNFFAQCQQNLEINKQQQHPCFANCLQDHHLCFGPNIHNFLILCS